MWKSLLESVSSYYYSSSRYPNKYPVTPKPTKVTSLTLVLILPHYRKASQQDHSLSILSRTIGACNDFDEGTTYCKFHFVLLPSTKRVSQKAHQDKYGNMSSQPLRQGKARLLMEIDWETRLACGSKSEIRRTSELQHRLSFVWPRWQFCPMFHFLPYFCIHSCEISNIVLANAFSNLSNPLFSTSSVPSLFLALPLHFDKIASWKSPLSHFFWLVTSKLYPTFLANATHNMGSRERSQILQVEKEKYLKHSSTSFEH